MPHFTLSISAQGSLVVAHIGVSDARRAALIAAKVTVPNLVKINALIDTGASATCVDEVTLQALNLTPTGSVPMLTPSTKGTPVTTDQYDISFLIPPASNIQPPLFVGTVPVICCDGLLTSQGFHALIGRDILSNCVFIYNGDMGSFTLAY